MAILLSFQYAIDDNLPIHVLSVMSFRQFHTAIFATLRAQFSFKFKAVATSADAYSAASAVMPVSLRDWI